jgi:acyl dehydratase
MMYWEDFEPGASLECGSRTVTQEEIVEFAKQFDPQPFHIDEAAAKASHFGGIIASGWHTSAICMRLAVDGVLSKTASMGSPGVQNLRWLKPLRPGMTVHAKVCLVDKTPSQTRTDRGRMTTRFELYDQNNELLMDFTAMVLMGRRPKT